MVFVFIYTCAHVQARSANETRQMVNRLPTKSYKSCKVHTYIHTYIRVEMGHYLYLQIKLAMFVVEKLVFIWSYY